MSNDEIEKPAAVVSTADNEEIDVSKPLARVSLAARCRVRKKTRSGGTLTITIN
jgi:hypothetical protein